ncbi:MAG: hypothetical protein ACI9U2_001514 [Bradymonadia bacterium]|jgi:hypothetical protein
MSEGTRRCPGHGCTWTTSDWTRCPTHDRCAVPVATLKPLKRAPHLGWLLDGRYVLLELKGMGGFAAVYLACDIKMHDQQVAVKLLLQAEADDQARFDREMKILAGLTHPRLLAISDRGEVQIGPTHCVFMVGEYLPHGSLADRLQSGPLSLVDAVRVVEQTAEGLACAHEAGIIHRDLKPANLMLTAAPAEPIGIKIIDFGIAKISDSTKTRGPPIGTIQYMSPEQITGEALTPASDVYALGIVLYEMLVGRRPFNGVPHFVEGQHKHSQPPHLPGYDSDHRLGRVDAVIQRALAKAPRDRYATTLQLSAALTRAAADAAPLPRTLTQPLGGPPSPGRAPAVAEAAPASAEGQQSVSSAVIPAAVAEVAPAQGSRWGRVAALIGLLTALGGVAWFASRDESGGAALVDAGMSARKGAVPSAPLDSGTLSAPLDQAVREAQQDAQPDARPRDAGQPDARMPKPCDAADLERSRVRLRANGCQRYALKCTVSGGIGPLLRRCSAARERRKCQSLKKTVAKTPHGPACRTLIKSAAGRRCKLMAVPARCGFCGDAVRNGDEDCDGSKGCTKGCSHDY